MLKYNCYISSLEDLKDCKLAGLDEVLICPAMLSRFGKLSLEEATDLAIEAKKQEISPVLVWDILMTETVLEKCLENISAWKGIEEFESIRVQDSGALYWLLEEGPNKDIHFIAETANANIEALKTWKNLIGSRLKRIVLSQQLTEETIVHYIKELKVPCEILAAGPILLFYTPRALLSAKLSKTEDDIIEADSQWLQALSSSEESHHREFPTIENIHGTFMFLNKDQFILDRLDLLIEAGLAYARIDLRQNSQENRSTEGLLDLLKAVADKTIDPKIHWPKPAFAPFFRRNQTTKQFLKLKPQIHKQRDETCVAKVLSGEKPNRVIFWALRNFDIAKNYSLVLPNGNSVDCPGLNFKDLDGLELKSCQEDQVFTSPWIKSACAGALLVERGE